MHGGRSERVVIWLWFFVLAIVIASRIEVVSIGISRIACRVGLWGCSCPIGIDGVRAALRLLAPSHREAP